MSKIVEPNAVRDHEPYLICFKNKLGEERILQSDLTADRADRSVEILNEHEKNNARRERFYWRAR